MRYLIHTPIILAASACLVYAQNRIGTGAVDELYQSMCASCHGKQLEGGLGGSLLDSASYKHVGKATNFLDYVKKGNVEMGMPSFEGALTDPQIRSLEIYINEVRQKTAREGKSLVAEVDGRYSAGGYEFKVEAVLEDLNRPWSIAFLPDGGALITEKNGALRLFKGGKLADPIDGIPKVWAKGQGGLLEVALHPEYEKNGWVYLTFSESGGAVDSKEVGMTKVVRGQIVGNTWKHQEVLFEVPVEDHRAAAPHFGSRIAFQDGYLFFSVGDRGAQHQAQDLTKPNGKIHRLHDDGRVPKDNPFVDSEYPSIWSFGNRNPQGLDFHPETGELWESEHGPRGGDEINVIDGGNNYGWPTITYGMHYNGKPITELTEKEGMEQPKHYWTPSIAVCGIDFYEGDRFPNWKNNLLVGGLASQELHRLEVEDGVVVKDEIILHNAGRIRDVASGPDGNIYLVIDNPGKILRIVPVK